MNYDLPIGDYRAMKDYIKTYQDLLRIYELPDLNLSYACFVSSGFKNIEGKLARLKEETNVSISAVTAQDLLAISNLNISQEHFIHVMSKGGIILEHSFDVITK